ncbi:MAG: glycosyltransferase, partial [Clostridia bacterium]|nr:glycosyltransferase [Clostridia bacterium]
MTIVVNDIAASCGGALTILESFYDFVAEHDKANRWIFLCGGDYLQDTDSIRILRFPGVKKSWLRKLQFDLFSGRRIIAALEPDVVLSMQNIITFGVKAPQALYLHQSLPFQRVKKFSLFKKDERISAIYQRIVGKLYILSAKKADLVIVQTKWMRKAVCERAKLREDKVISILPVLSDLTGYKREGLWDSRKFFYPTADNAYKNNGCIYAACDALKEKGVSGFSVKLTIAGTRKDASIEYTRALPRTEVIHEYNASTLIFPSFVETVGLPLVEARQMGTLVLASDCPFSREVLEGYENAYFFD